MLRLEGKAAIVTGGGRGIGYGVAVKLAECGADVVVNYRSSEAGALEAKRAIEGMGRRALLIRADTAREDEVNAMVRETASAFGGVDILVNNAGIQMNYLLDEYRVADYDKMIATNVKGYFHCIRAVVPYMKARRFGRIINITSIHAKRPLANDPVYGMTKGALKMLTRESAIEFARYGITTNAVEPGAVEVGVRTGFPEGQQNPDEPSFLLSEAFTGKIPVKRVGFPCDIAPMVAFLACDEAGYINGAAMRIDGGAILV